MLQLNNPTPFETAHPIIPDRDGSDCLVLMVKATFTLSDPPRICEEQRPLEVSDVYRGDPADSSLERATELHPPKPTADIVLLGQAWAPGGRPVDSLRVGLKVGTLETQIAVTGDRLWKKGLTAPGISRPEPFTRMPLIYERAFGGGSRDHYLPENPAGCGFFGKRKRGEIVGSPLPNLEHPDDRIRSPRDRVRVAGTAFIAPTWSPRLEAAGTYDAGWERQRAPFLPEDFDAAHFQAAHPDLRYPTHLRGGEPVVLLNLAENPDVRLRLPVDTLSARIRSGSRVTPLPLQRDTLVLEPDAGIFLLIWRGLYPCDKRAHEIDGIDLAVIEGVDP